MSVTRRYREAWEAFWRAAPVERGAVFWDAEPALTAALHLALFEPHLVAEELPLVDLGCGNGTQSRFLAGTFPRVVGLDLSAAAIDRARRADPAGDVEFRQFDAVQEGAAGLLHAELGDANLYMRGVLHQCEPAARQPLADAIATLTGERGRAFVVEPSEAARPVLLALAGGPGGPPPKLAPVFAHGLTPADVVDDAVPRHFAAAGLTVLASGELPLFTTESAPDGSRVELPSRWFAVGRTAN
ncbi:methyltransferase domain-containing protein [Streptomyces flavofungini]|uniref:methyltransferase domain-containing protein n=1 Tax=Streptomyces flavofungini TaxID=68200 RepID=UPI0034DF4483